MLNAWKRWRAKARPQIRNASHVLPLTPLEPRLLFTSPLSSVPVLNSHPTASRPLYLDFNGTPAENWGLVSVPATPAFNQDSDPASFSDSELASIREIFARVAEKYAPFDLNVTTVDPLTWVDDESPASVRIVIGGNGNWWQSGVVGIAYVGGFYTPQPNTGYVFSQDLGNASKAVAETVAHEAGHLFGLEHQSVYSGTTRTIEYNPGTAEKAPIMGNSRTSARGLWWNGPNAISSTTIQDDLAVLGSVLGSRQDDRGNNIASAAPLTVTNLSMSGDGIIEQASDLDVFSVNANAGSVSFTVTPGSHVLAQTSSSSGAMLDLKLELRNSVGTTIAAADTTSLGETLTASVTAGTYYLVVASHGQYGDIGTYNITGTLPAPDVTPPGISAASYDFQTGPQRLTLRFSENVQSSLTLSSFRLQNLITGTLIDPGTMSLSYDIVTNTATVTFPGLGGILPDGNYTLTVLGNWVWDLAGNKLDGGGSGTPGTDYTLSFFVLAGDANRDRAVNFFDMTTLSASYGMAGRTWADGDFNGDGQVNFFDLTILSANYSNSLPVPSEPLAGAPVGDPVAVVVATAAQEPIEATVVSEAAATQVLSASNNEAPTSTLAASHSNRQDQSLRRGNPRGASIRPVIPLNLPRADDSLSSSRTYLGLFSTGEVIERVNLKRRRFRR